MSRSLPKSVGTGHPTPAEAMLRRNSNPSEALGVRDDLANATAAVAVCERPTESKSVLLGGDDPSIAATLGQKAPTVLTLHVKACALASADRAADLAAGVVLYDHVIETTTAALGADHPHAVLGQREKTNLLELIGGSANLSEAVALCDHVIEINAATFGADHPGTAEILHRKATVLAQMGGSNVDKAVALFSRVIEIFSAVSGADHTRIAWIWHQKANGLMQMGGSANLLEAIALLDRVIEIRTAATGADGPHTRVAMSQKAMALAKMEACTKSSAAPSNRKSARDFDVVPMGFNSMGWKPFPVGDFIEVYSDNMRIVALTADEVTAVVAELFEQAAHDRATTAKASKRKGQQAGHPSKAAAVHAKAALARVDSANLGALWRQIST
jgi:hypothetical protein